MNAKVAKRVTNATDVLLAHLHNRDLLLAGSCMPRSCVGGSNSSPENSFLRKVRNPYLATRWHTHGQG